MRDIIKKILLTSSFLFLIVTASANQRDIDLEIYYNQLSLDLVKTDGSLEKIPPESQIVIKSKAKGWAWDIDVYDINDQLIMSGQTSRSILLKASRLVSPESLIATLLDTNQEDITLTPELEPVECQSNGAESKDAPEAQTAEVANSLYREPAPSQQELIDWCVGNKDEPIGIQTNPDATLDGPKDYMMNFAYHARNIKNATTRNCKKANMDNVIQVNKDEFGRDPNSNTHVSIQDYINYRCNSNVSNCESIKEDELKENYTDAYNRLSSAKKENLPTADEFFASIPDNTKFKDKYGNEVQIPIWLVHIMMNSESKANPSLIEASGITSNLNNGLGLFQITQTNKSSTAEFRKPKLENGVVVGTESSEFNTTRDISNENSVLHPTNNILKFTQIVRDKYIQLQEKLNDEDGIDFSQLSSDDEKWSLIGATFNGGANTVLKPHKRLLSFNKAQKCNTCEQLKPDGNGQCSQTAVKTCDVPLENACNQTMDATLAAVERFHNFSEVDNVDSYKDNMKCMKELAGFGNDSKGPCSTAITFNYSRKIRGQRQCFQ